MSPSAYATGGATNATISMSGGFGSSTNSSSMAAGGSASRPFIIGGSNLKPPTTSATNTANATPDFESLLANSASLLSSMGRSTGGGGARAASTMGSGGPSTLSSAFGSSSTNTAYSQPSAATVALGDKSLLELNVASRTTAANATNNAMAYEAEASAHRLLAREGYGFDSARLGRSARELERRANNVHASSGGGGMMEEEKKEGMYDALEGGGAYTTAAAGGDSQHALSNLQGATVQQILSSHHEHCVHKALRQARETTFKQAQQRVDERLKCDWEKERQEILGRGVLGNRFLMGGVAGSGSGGLEKGEFGGMGGVASRVPLLEGDSMATTSASSPWSNIVPSPQMLPPNMEGLVKSHLVAIDRHLTTANAAPTSTQTTMLLASLQEGLKDAAAGLSPDNLNGYSNAFSLIRSIVNCSASLGLDVSASETSNNITRDVYVAAGVMGSCNFFAQQFASHVKEVVSEAEMHFPSSSTVNNGGLTSMARDVSAFATIVAGRDVVEGTGGVWPRLFYCLRCGDLNAASSILKQFGSGNAGGNSMEDMSLVDPAVSNLVSQLAQLQQTQDTMFGDSTNGNTRSVQQLQTSLLSPSQSLMQFRRQVSDLYERTKTRSSQSSSESMEQYMYYRAACLAMLGGSESISEAVTLEKSGLVETVEDYMYASLWHALHLADDASSSSSMGVGSGGGVGLRKVAEAVARLSVLINQWGPSYFEMNEDVNGKMYTSALASVELAAQGGTGGGASGVMSHKVPRSGGWAYTLPLLVSQQYATALAYLAEAGGGLGLLQATHVGVVMDVAGLSISDFTLDNEQRSNNSVSSKLSQQTLLPMLVASYSASLQGLDAGAALKYLVLLSGKGKFVKEQVQRLILETRQFEILAGKIEPDGSRSNGALDTYFTKKEVSSLLMDTAHHAIGVGKPADAAELLVLSGQFGALFSLMNRELASYLNASTQEDFVKRQFWFNAASQFHAIHLAQGRTYVQNTLDKEGNMSLGNTFQLLMNLVVFFDRCREQQWEGAWVLVDELQLIPKVESEMTIKVEAFRALDNCVRQVFHHVVLAAMEALCHLFRTLKQSGAGVSIDQRNTIDQSLNELRTRARLLVTFSRLLNLPSLGDSDTYVRISQLEKNMM